MSPARKKRKTGNPSTPRHVMVTVDEASAATLDKITESMRRHRGGAVGFLAKYVALAQVIGAVGPLVADLERDPAVQSGDVAIADRLVQVVDDARADLAKKRGKRKAA